MADRKCNARFTSTRKIAKWHFWATLWETWGDVVIHLYLVGKRVIGFLCDNTEHLQLALTTSWFSAVLRGGLLWGWIWLKR